MTEELGSLWVLRHGQSLGNVANDRARAHPVDRLDIAERDMDVPLSSLGERQAAAFGAWLATVDPGERPDIVVASPYVRALQTARIVLDVAELDLKVTRDERLREREFGVLDLLTRRGITANHPQEAERRTRLGKFYYRPPGGESWVDVALRLRSLRDSLVRQHAGRRVLLVTHEVPIIMLRYLIEDLDESESLALSASRRIANCSLTTYRPDEAGLALHLDAWTAPLERQTTPVTDEPDAAVAPR